MAAFFRIVQSQWAHDAMSGEGARLHGGRWNPPGVAAVYLAESRALAALEIMVHAPRRMLLAEWRMIRVEVPDEWIDPPGRPPDGWRAQPASESARTYGGGWLEAGRGLALRLPSVIIPEEHALLVNPRHPRAGRLAVPPPMDFRFDTRLGD